MSWLLVGSALSGCAILGQDVAEAPLSDEERTRQIESLREAVELDHARLEELITAPGSNDGHPLQQNPEVEAIAARLEARRSELLELESVQ